MTMKKFFTTIFEEITAADAQGMHYLLAAIATLVLVVRYAVWRQFDALYGGFVITFWGTAIGNEKINTPSTPPPE